MTERPAPQVNVSPTHGWGRPVMKGIHTEMLADTYLACGADEVQDDYNLNRHELLVTLWFEATHGRHRKLWRAWAREAEKALADTRTLQPDQVELPPR